MRTGAGTKVVVGRTNSSTVSTTSAVRWVVVVSRLGDAASFAAASLGRAATANQCQTCNIYKICPTFSRSWQMLLESESIITSFFAENIANTVTCEMSCVWKTAKVHYIA